MAVDDLWRKKGPEGKLVPSARDGRGKRYRVRYTDPQGNPKTKLYAKKGEAERADLKARSDIARGEYIDPAAGKVTFRDVAERWRGNAVHKDSTQAKIEADFRLHVYPRIGGRAMRDIRHSDIQSLVKQMTETLAPATVEVIYGYVNSVFIAAVRDGLIPRSPCVGISRPEVEKRRVVPLPIQVVKTIREAMPPEQRVLADLGAMAGLRQGEAFGLEVEHVDFLRRVMHVRQQLKYLAGAPPFLAPPKSVKSKRTIPIGRELVNRLAAHLHDHPPVPVEIVDKTGPKPIVRRVRLICTNQGRPWLRSGWSKYVWRPALVTVGLVVAGEPAKPEDPTFHDERHFYASALIAKGASVLQVQHRLGHSTAKETTDTYGHLWPDEDDRTRDIIDGLPWYEDQDRSRAVP